MIYLKTDEEIDRMRRAGGLACELLDYVETLIQPGTSTLALNDALEAYTQERGARSAPLNYKGFPKSICTSVNEVVCHGIPSRDHILKAGDIINVDVTPIVDGFHGDASRTYPVGAISTEASKLIECTQSCLEAAISVVAEDARIGDIGAIIQELAESQGYQVVREFVGHGIGRNFHEDPQIPHYGSSGRGAKLAAGMVFTIEPMINLGDWRCELLDDGWTAVTSDRTLSAQFEHTLAIRSDGRVEVLTATPYTE